MGWSCTAKASGKLERIEKACEQTRQGTDLSSSNVFVQGGKQYFYEVLRRDQKDGGIAGTINLCWTETDGREVARQTGTFRIDGEGNVVRGPKIFRDA